MEPLSNWIYKYAEFVVALAFLLVGIALVGQFGVPWDEYYLQENAIRNLDWIQSFITDEFSKDQIFEGNVDEHGPIIQLLILAVEKLVDPKNLSELIWLRHFVGYSICVLGIFYLIKLLKYVKFSSWQILLGVAAISLHPRIFGHSFFNSKDTVLMYLFIINTYCLLNYLKNKSWINLFVFAVLSALITDIRMIGAIFPVLLIGYLIIVKFFRSIEPKISLNHILLFGLTFLISTYLFWPFLWDNPLLLIDKLKALSVAKQPNLTFFEGEFFIANQLPWYYVPKFIVITTPFPILMLLGLGLVSPFLLIQKLKENQSNLLAVSIIISFITLLSVILFSPVLYNGWRHFQFIWPFLIFPGIISLGEILRRLRSSNAVNFGLGIGVLAYALYTVFSFFPYSHAYFNPFVKNPSQQYEVDYWGLSFKTAFDFLETREYFQPGKIWVSDKPGRLNYELTSDQFKKNYVLTQNIAEANYIITNYCYFETIDGSQWNHLRNLNAFPFDLEEDYVLRKNQVKIISIYRNDRLELENFDTDIMQEALGKD